MSSLKRIVTHRFFAAAAIVLLSLAVRIPWAANAVVTPISDYHGYDVLAQGLAAGLDFGRTPDGGFHGHAYRTIGYPLFLSAVYETFGHSYTAVAMAQAVLGALCSLLVFMLALQLVGRKAAVMAALLYALSPVFIAYVPVLASENLATFFGLICFWLLAYRVEEYTTRRDLYWLVVVAGAGVALGAAMLTRPASLFFVPGCLLAVALRKGFGGWLRLCGCLTFITMLVATLSPWLIRNAKLDLGLTLSSVGGRNLFMGNNDQATQGGFLAKRLPKIAGENEAEYDSRHMSVAFGWIRSHPGRYARLCQVRLTRLIGSQPDGWAAAYLWPTAANDKLVVDSYLTRKTANPDQEVVKNYYRMNGRHQAFLRFIRDILAPLALLAFFFALARWRFFLPILAPWAGYILGLSLTVSAERYRLPAEPLTFVLIGALLSGLIFKTKELHWPKKRLTKLIVVVAVVAAFNIAEQTGLTKNLYKIPDSEIEKPVKPQVPVPPKPQLPDPPKPKGGSLKLDPGDQAKGTGPIKFSPKKPAAEEGTGPTKP
jgi:4-amino-4-deoxy-L-arabinose transferase-like glycosyltransferase